MILEHKGIKIFYTAEGQGPTIVLLHGFMENSSMWKKSIPILRENNQIICIDLLGHGHTECLGYIHTMEDMADAVHVVLLHLKINQFTCIGHSMGGYVALALAEMHPESLTGLCLMNSTFEADDDERKLLRQRANKMVQSNFSNMVRLSFTNLFSQESVNLYKNEIDQAVKEALKTPIQGYIAGQEGMRIRKDRFTILNSLTCKTLIIIGEKDPVIDGLVLQEKIKNTQINSVILTEGHMSHIENRSEFLHKIVHFIEKI